MCDPFANEENLEVIERLAAFCAERGRSMLELAFGWLLAHPHVSSVIAGATSPEQLRQNASALGWELTADEITVVDRIDTHRRLLEENVFRCGVSRRDPASS